MGAGGLGAPPARGGERSDRGIRSGDEFTPLWAHDRAAERKALVDFLAMVRKRRKRHPKMHIYHYAPYEKTALLRLAGRYGVGEDEVDDLLRNGVLVDLYPMVRKSIRVGTENYSLKSLEPLYMGSELRDGEVTTATDSITMYAKYCELRAEGRDDEAANVLKEIEDYNRYDCRSTRKLRDWLLGRAFEAGVPPLGPQPVRDSGQVEVDDDVARTLARFAGDDTRAACRRDDRGRPRVSPPRGQAVLVGPLRPAQQPGRRMVGHPRRFPRRPRRRRRGLACSPGGQEAAALGASVRFDGRR